VTFAYKANPNFIDMANQSLAQSYVRAKNCVPQKVLDQKRHNSRVSAHLSLSSRTFLEGRNAHQFDDVDEDYMTFDGRVVVK